MIGLALPRQTTESLQSTAEELIKVALDRTAADASKACDLVMSESLAFQPQNFHFLLDAGMGMLVAFGAEGSKVVRGEGKATHGELQCSWQPTPL